jgi:Metallopeptidase family M24
MAAVVTAGGVLLVAPTADAPAALAGGYPRDRYVPYGSFFYDRAAGQPPGPEAGRAAGSLPAGVRAALDALAVAGAVGVDEADLAPAVRAALESLAPRLRVCGASDWFLSVRRPGITAGELFDTAVRTVEQHGLRPYRRHHCGHAIGMASYETPVISPGTPTAVEPGDVYCLETPFYELGWGGMMIEDTVAVGDHANDVFTTLDRELHQVPA